MIINNIESIKGFMPSHEGEALYSWANKFCHKGPVIEIGTYCGKSTIYLAHGALEADEIVYTIDHHSGSEEHQIKEEYFDSDVYDQSINRVNTFPLFLENIKNYNLENVVPIVASSLITSKSWQTPAGLIFIDGGHSMDSALSDYNSWAKHVVTGGALVIHDIYEDPEKGGQAPYEIYKIALQNGFVEYERVDTIVCLVKV